MKIKLLILIIAILLTAPIVFGQTENEIARIRKDVNLINKNVKKYFKKVGNVEGISLEGTEATYFISGRGLKKIVAKIYGETYRATVELFYSGEEMIFAYQKISRYDTQIGMNPPPKVVSVKETRFYFLGGNLVKILEGKKNIKNSDESWKSSRTEINDLSGKLKEALFAMD